MCCLSAVVQTDGLFENGLALVQGRLYLGGFTGRSWTSAQNGQQNMLLQGSAHTFPATANRCRRFKNLSSGFNSLPRDGEVPGASFISLHLFPGASAGDVGASP